MFKKIRAKYTMPPMTESTVMMSPLENRSKELGIWIHESAERSKELVNRKELD